MTKLGSQLDRAEQAAFEALKWKAAAEVSISDDPERVAFLLDKSNTALRFAENAINSCLVENDPVDFEDPYAVLIFAAGVREGLV